MKKLASVLLGLLLSGCLATHEGNPLKKNSDIAPVSSKAEAAPVSTTLWWQKRDGFDAKPATPSETTDPDEKWQGWSEEELAPVFPKDWKPAPPEKPEEKPKPEKPKQPRGEVY
jgi:hypothetical protein